MRIQIKTEKTNAIKTPKFLLLRILTLLESIIEYSYTLEPLEDF